MQVPGSNQKPADARVRDIALCPASLHSEIPFADDCQVQRAHGGYEIALDDSRPIQARIFTMLFRAADGQERGQ